MGSRTRAETRRTDAHRARSTDRRAAQASVRYTAVHAQRCELVHRLMDTTERSTPHSRSLHSFQRRINVNEARTTMPDLAFTSLIEARAYTLGEARGLRKALALLRTESGFVSRLSSSPVSPSPSRHKSLTPDGDHAQQHRLHYRTCQHRRPGKGPRSGGGADAVPLRERGWPPAMPLSFGADC